MSIIDMKSYRLRRGKARYTGEADVTLRLWVDPQDGEIVCSQLEGNDTVPVGSGIECNELLNTLLSAVSRTGAMFRDEGSDEGWMSDPVMLAKLTRAGFLTIKPHHFWHTEATNGWYTRLRCACWASRQGFRVIASMWWWCVLLVFAPAKLRKLEIE